jgi:hypothetical protein
MFNRVDLTLNDVEIDGVTDWDAVDELVPPVLVETVDRDDVNESVIFIPK